MDQRIAYGFLRLILGLDICFHGVSRLLGDHAAFLAYLTQSMSHAPLIPKATLPVFAAVLPWIEATVGFFILFGLFTRVALIAGLTVMALLMAGITLAQDWSVAGLQLIYCVIYFILLAYRDRNFFSLDALLRVSLAKVRGICNGGAGENSLELPKVIVAVLVKKSRPQSRPGAVIVESGIWHCRDSAEEEVPVLSRHVQRVEKEDIPSSGCSF